MLSRAKRQESNHSITIHTRGVLQLLCRGSNRVQQSMKKTVCKGAVSCEATSCQHPLISKYISGTTMHSQR